MEPRDIALAGMDDAGPFDLLPLTTVSAHLPSHELGVESMRLRSGRIDGTSATQPPRQITLSTSIHTHDSGAGYLRAVSSESA